tara:strand:+ start:568 stop:693 length:126 start_codon:yes stop_codon:yes gene_type:complete
MDSGDIEKSSVIEYKKKRTPIETKPNMINDLSLYLFSIIKI